ncbi:MAG: hypothetical protein RLZZ84_1373 [Pseudomonadota bacterium]|jgi:DNA-binding MarR family transcriptional regulator
MEHIGYLLGDRSRLLRRAFDERVRALGVTGPQARLLFYLTQQEGENQGFYADELDVEPITLCRMVDRLEEAGMIERRRAPADRRVWQLYLTQHSRETMPALRECADVLLEEMLAGISPAQREAFAHTLTVIGANLGARRDNKVPTDG